MVDDQVLKRWFCEEVLPLERQLMGLLRRHGRGLGNAEDLRQDVYANLLAAASEHGLPSNTKAYVMVTARNLLINAARRSRIVSFELAADLEQLNLEVDLGATDRRMNARDDLRETQVAMDSLSPRAREVVRLCKVEGYSVREAASQLQVSQSSIEKHLTSAMRTITNHLLGGSPTQPRQLGLPRRMRERRS